jgi:ribose transport system substrate-binding protein
MKRFLKLSLIIALGVTLGLAVFGCQGTSAEEEIEGEVEEVGAEEADITVGFSLPFIEDSPYTFPFAEALREEAAARGWKLIMTDAGGDINTQSNQIEDLVAQGIDGLMIMPVDAAGIVAVIQRVHEETGGELPVICSNVMTDPPELDELDAFAGPDSYLEGKQIGEYYVNYLRDNGIESINYCETQGTAGYSAAIDRHNGFLDALEEQGATDMFNELDSQPCDWSPDKAQAQTENWITTYGEEMEMVYSHNDGMAIGIINALQDAGYEPGEVITNGCDGQTEAVKFIIEGWQLFTVFQSPAEDAATGMRTMEKILAGEDVPYWNYMETPIIDSSNAEEYLPIVEELWEQ